MKSLFGAQEIGFHETGKIGDDDVLADGKTAQLSAWRPFALWALLLYDLVFVKGYQFGVKDQHFYLPQLLAEIDPSLYPNSTAILRSTSEFSFFNTLFTLPSYYIGVETTFLLAYLVASASFYLVCFLLAKKLSGSHLAAYGFLLLMLPATWAPGTATKVWDNYLLHRGIVLPLCLFGVYQMLSRKHAVAYLLFGLSALIHPITAAAFAAAGAVAIVYDWWRKEIALSAPLLIGGALLVGASPLLWKVLVSPNEDVSFFSSTTPEWVAIVRERAPYMLPQSWSLGLWSRGAWFLLFLLAWLAKPVRSREDAVSMAIVVGCGVLLGLSMIVGSVFPVLPLARFEFARALVLVILFARLYLAMALFQGFMHGSPLEKISAVLGAVTALSLYGEYLSPLRVGVVVCAMLVVGGTRLEWMSSRSRRMLVGGILGVEGCLLGSEFLAAFDLFPGMFPARWISADSVAVGLMAIAVLAIAAILRPFRSFRLSAVCSLVFCLIYVSSLSPEGLGVKSLYFPGFSPVTPWVQAQLWAKEHTPKDAVFFAPWKQSGFPVFSQRSIVGDWKSGGDGKFNPVFARQWWEWRNDFGDFDKLDAYDFCRLHEKYRFQYIVTEKRQPLEFPLVYENREFSIYRYLDNTCQDGSVRQARDQSGA